MHPAHPVTYVSVVFNSQADATEKKKNQVFIVIAAPADEAMALAKMLYFLPSIASDFVRPMIPALAVEYWF